MAGSDFIEWMVASIPAIWPAQSRCGNSFSDEQDSFCNNSLRGYPKGQGTCPGETCNNGEGQREGFRDAQQLLPQYNGEAVSKVMIRDGPAAPSVHKEVWQRVTETAAPSVHKEVWQRVTEQRCQTRNPSQQKG